MPLKGCAVSHSHPEGSAWGLLGVCAVQGGEEQSSLSLARATCPALGCSGPFVREPVIFLLVERQQGGGLGKDSKSHLIIYNIMSLLFFLRVLLKKPIFSLELHLLCKSSLYAHGDREEKTFAHLLGQ